MKLFNLSLPEQASGFTHKIVVTNADLTATGNTQTLDLLALVLGQIIGRIAFRVVTAFDFSDATLVSLAATLGDGASANRYIASSELCADGTVIYAAVSGSGAPFIYTAAGALKLGLTGTSAKALNTATAGELHIFVQLTDLTKL